MELRSLAECWPCDRYCRIGLTIPLRPCAGEAEAPSCWTLRSSRKQRFARKVNSELYPLVELRLLQSLTGPCRHRRRGLATSLTVAPLMGFPAPSTFGVPAEQPSRSLPDSVRCALRVSHPHSALLPAGPSGLVSCRYRPWGFPFRAFSSRGAVPPLGGQCPPGVFLSPFTPHDPTLPRETGRSPLLASGLAPVASALASSRVLPPATIGAPPPRRAPASRSRQRQNAVS
jgi:hypothetical protein